MNVAELLLPMMENQWHPIARRARERADQRLCLGKVKEEVCERVVWPVETRGCNKTGAGVARTPARSIDARALALHLRVG